MRDARLLGRLACHDFCFLDGARALDFAPASFFLIGDARIGDDAILLNACRLDRLARRDLGLLHRPHAFDLALPYLALGGDARGVDRTLIGDSRLFDLLARLQFLFLHRARAFDFLLPGLALGCDASLGDGLLVGDFCLLDRFARGDLRLLGFGLAQRALARDLRALLGATHLDVALLLEAGGFALALDIERLPFGFEIAGADPDHRILFDVVAQFAPGLDILH